jgi:hypothetical protein
MVRAIGSHAVSSAMISARQPVAQFVAPGAIVNVLRAEHGRDDQGRDAQHGSMVRPTGVHQPRR